MAKTGISVIKDIHYPPHHAVNYLAPPQHVIKPMVYDRLEVIYPKPRSIIDSVFKTYSTYLGDWRWKLLEFLRHNYMVPTVGHRLTKGQNAKLQRLVLYFFVVKCLPCDIGLSLIQNKHYKDYKRVWPNIISDVKSLLPRINPLVEPDDDQLLIDYHKPKPNHLVQEERQISSDCRLIRKWSNAKFISDDKYYPLICKEPERRKVITDYYSNRVSKRPILKEEVDRILKARLAVFQQQKKTHLQIDSKYLVQDYVGVYDRKYCIWVDGRIVLREAFEEGSIPPSSNNKYIRLNGKLVADDV